MPGAETYDAVVVGASFAGLAAAGQLAGSRRVLLADREPVGAGETSACGTPLAVLERLEAGDALEQVCPEVVIHVGDRPVRFRPSYPFATFDYRTLCEILASRLGDIESAVAPFRGIADDGALLLGERRVKAGVVIDASGWRRVVARALGAAPADRGHLSAGVETRAARGGCALEFWLRPPGLAKGVHWAFPAGDHSREGSASYVGETRGLRSDLAGFEGVDDFPPRAVHGGCFPSRLGPAVWRRLFVVGDAAGQCLPLTGEGVRPALVFGQEAGRQAQGVLMGAQPLEVALSRYRGCVEHARRAYLALERFQSWAIRWPLSVVGPAVRACSWEPVSRRLESVYWHVADPDTLEAAPEARTQGALADGCCETGPAVARRADHPAPRSPVLAPSAARRDHPHSSECGCDEPSRCKAQQLLRGAGAKSVEAQP